MLDRQFKFTEEESEKFNQEADLQVKETVDEVLQPDTLSSERKTHGQRHSDVNEASQMKSGKDPQVS